MEYFSQSDFVCGMCLQAANTLNLSVSTDNSQLPIGFSVFNFDDCLFEDFVPFAFRTDNAIVTTDDAVDEPLFNTSSDYEPLTGFGLKDKGLRVAAYNVQHYANKVEIIRTILTQTNGLPDILFLIETWLDDTYTDNELEVPGYLLLRKDRSSKRGGGIVAYVRHEISFHRRTDLESNDLEILWLEINHSNMKPILVAGVYRPPDTNMATDSKLEDILSQGYFEGKEFYALGDLNINIHDPSAMNHQLVQGLHAMSMTQLVNVTTRPASNTCLDHIWCTTEDNIVRISVPQIGLSDHFPVCFIRKFNGGLCREKSHLTIKYRCFKMFDSAKFIKDLENVPWQKLAAIDTDPDAALDTFERLFNDVINDHAPMKEKRVKLWRQPPWMKPEILSKMKKRDRLLKEAINVSGKVNRNTEEW
ncbi:RNA-directed DNA polymerase from mobile element jockey [Paramuricea clavata]|uniref:RNA-directed DNA polymerase from mobile element jockey n=2 Tax=Paramuricea clavata TaxID=317549 RepID=A0A6S7J0S8_PARCT|nr:RNA-directed DNA polymerase from mobile element jockey [Paramuricea clavata]